MNVFYVFYTALSHLLILPLLPFMLLYVWITGKYRDHLGERFGRVPQEAVQKVRGKPCVWVHAVSLGEVKVTRAVITSLKQRLPEHAIVLSTTTKHGRESALELFQHEDIPVLYAPLDLAVFVRKALSSIRPRALVFIETEIWPAWILEARRMGIAVAMANGRISPRSFPSYMRLRFFFKEILARFDVFSMIHPRDRERIVAMGAPADRVVVGGNAKYDHIGEGIRPETEARMRAALGIPPGSLVLLAGSTREGEEEQILDAYEKIRHVFPHALLIIAPRHIERAGGIAALVAQRGLSCRLRTEMQGEMQTEGGGSAPVMILNTFGELFHAYSLATVVFCGASLVPLGGQNPLEPAAWNKPVLYGPSMEDFPDAREMLERAGGGMTVADAQALAHEVVRLFHDENRRQTMGEKAGKAMGEHQGAAEKHARWIEKLLSA